MSDEPPSDVLGGLPRSRPHRRSAKRGTPAGSATNGARQTPGVARPTGGQPTDPGPATPHSSGPQSAAKQRSTTPRPATPRSGAPRSAARPRPRSERLRQPAQPAGTPPSPGSRKPVPASGADLLGTAVQAAAELAEMGLSATARALRSAVARLPRP
jgi:hypothetical protein